MDQLFLWLPWLKYPCYIRSHYIYIYIYIYIYMYVYTCICTCTYIHWQNQQHIFILLNPYYPVPCDAYYTQQYNRLPLLTRITCRLQCQAIVEVKWWFANKGTTERYMLGIRAKFCTLNIVYVASRPFRSREVRVNTLRPIQNGHHFPDDIFKCIFLNGNVWISLII